MPIRLKPTPVDVPAEDPFKNDLLGREKNAQVLTQFVARLDEPFVLALDSPWGSGKTTFLKMWLQSLRNEHFQCLYFNAWENDYSDSPFVSLIGEIGDAIKELRLAGKQEQAAHRIFEKAKRSGALLGKAALPAVIKLATAGLLDLSALKSDDIEKLVEELAKQQIEKYQADKQTIRHFREELSTLVETLRQPNDSAPPKPIIFVIDELDRCRPPYAIALMEKIKHLFSVDGLVFVLGIDRRQLGESVKALYGRGVDADNYLRRFIDLEYRLPRAEVKGFVHAQFARFGLNQLVKPCTPRLQEDSTNLVMIAAQLFEVFCFHLRTQEQCFTQLAIVLNTTPSNCHLFPFLLVPLLCLRTANTPLYNAYCSGRASPADIVSFVRGLEGGEQFMASRVGQLVEAYLIFGITDWKQRDAEIEHIKQLAQSQKGDPIAVKRAQQVVDCFQWLPVEADDITKYLHDKIELTQAFVDPPPEPRQNAT